MQNSALIFGITGQDGYYLRQICEERGVKVYGVSRTNGHWIRGDVSDAGFVDKLINRLQCSYVFHFAATSTTRHDALYENHAAVATGTINILEACRRHTPYARVFLAGSALQFENNSAPINERGSFAATSAYVAARNYASYAARYYRRLGLQVYVGYFFHHDSPLRSENHLSMRIVRAVQRIHDGSDERVLVSNPSVIKEFNYAGDMMEAVWLIVNQESIHETVIGSGQGYAISDWVEICFGIVGKNCNTYLSVSDDGPIEFTSLVADPATLVSLGWKPKVGIHELAKMMMNTWPKEKS